MAATYVYKVRDRQGKLIQGSLEGDSLTTIVTKLRQMGYVVVDVSERSVASKEIAIPGFSNRVKPKDLTVFSRQFATMINAGLSLTKSLAILSEQTESKALSKIVAEMLQDVEKGRALSESMVKHARTFPSIFINMVKAGEAGGVLDEVLMRVADHFESEAAIKSKIKSAMAYPTVMFMMSMLITFVLITFIVPIFVNMFSQMGGDLPLPTKLLLGLSGFMQTWWWALGISGIAFYFAFRSYKRTENGRMKVDTIKLKLPIFGKLIQKMSVGRFSRTLGTLLSSGVPILQALEIVADSSGNAVVARAVKATRGSIKEGETIAKPLTGDKVFPPMVVQMIAVGEETGALDTMLDKIADFYDQEVSTAVETLTSIIEPILIVVMGMLIGGIIVSLYLPMFNIITLIK
ncbi:MAG: type II secretion system F family protein [Candidatus Aquicultorales bacterium]